MERHRSIRTALACALTIFVGLFLCSFVAASTLRRESGSLAITATAHAGAIAKRAIRTGSSLHVDKRDQGVSRERGGDDFPMHAWLAPSLARVAIHRGSERAPAPSRSRSTLQNAPLRRWIEARAPPPGSFA